MGIGGLCEVGPADRLGVGLGHGLRDGLGVGLGFGLGDGFGDGLGLRRDEVKDSKT
jgi:hypothetical protein